eukprot:Opistho-2@96750
MPVSPPRSVSYLERRLFRRSIYPATTGDTEESAAGVEDDDDTDVAPATIGAAAACTSTANASFFALTGALCCSAGTASTTVTVGWLSPTVAWRSVLTVRRGRSSPVDTGRDEGGCVRRKSSQSATSRSLSIDPAIWGRARVSFHMHFMTSSQYLVVGCCVHDLLSICKSTLNIVFLSEDSRTLMARPFIARTICGPSFIFPSESSSNRCISSDVRGSSTSPLTPIARGVHRKKARRTEISLRKTRMTGDCASPEADSDWFAAGMCCRKTRRSCRVIAPRSASSCPRTDAPVSLSAARMASICLSAALLVCRSSLLTCVTYRSTDLKRRPEGDGAIATGDFVGICCCCFC